METNDTVTNFDLYGNSELKKTIMYLSSRVSCLEEKLNDLRSYVCELEDSINFGSCKCCGCNYEGKGCDCCNCTDLCGDE